MRGFTFIRQTKLHDVCGRVNYISSHEEQEHLYATYETNPEPFWEDLARECQEEFTKSGAHGRCIEARELVIALPKSLQQFKPNELLKYFTEEFKKEYGVECSSALHHNPRRTNYHIHLVYAERTLLDNPIKKVAGRNIFIDASGRKVRTKKEILDKDGNLLPYCRIIPKGTVYEQHKSGKELKVYTIKNSDLKKFSQEAKRYGVLYCVLKDKDDKSEHAAVDVIARAEDASKIQRIVERFQLATVDAATVMSDITEKEKLFPDSEKSVKEKLNIEREGKNVNPSLAKTEKSPLSEPDLKQENRSNGLTASLKTKPSVKEKLDKYKDQATAKKIKAKSENNIAEKFAERTPSLPKVNGKER